VNDTPWQQGGLVGPLIKTIWVVAFALLAVLVLEIVLFIGIRQERQAYNRVQHTDSSRR
jgi:hypothetical protein